MKKLFFVCLLTLNFLVKALNLEGCPIKDIVCRKTKKCTSYEITFYGSDSIMFCVVTKINWMDKDIKAFYITGPDFYRLKKQDAKKFASKVKELFKQKQKETR